MRLFSFQTYERMEQEEKGSAGFDQTGTLVVATNPPVETYIQAGISLAKGVGYTGEYLNYKRRIKDILTDLEVSDILGAGWTADDGYFDATMAANTDAKKMKVNGGQVYPFTKVEALKKSGNRVRGVETNHGSFDFDLVAEASGPWTRYTSRIAGLVLPIWHTKAEVFFLAPP